MKRQCAIHLMSTCDLPAFAESHFGRYGRAIVVADHLNEVAQATRWIVDFYNAGTGAHQNVLRDF
jgi:hypothetical protein